MGPFSAEEVSRSKTYQRRIRIASQLALVSSVGLLAGLVAVADRARSVVDALPWPLGLAVTVVVVHLVGNAPFVVLGAYRSLRVDREFGLTTTSVRTWWRDARRELAANGVVVLFNAMILWTAVRFATPTWAAAWAALSMASVVVFTARPIVVGWAMPLAPADPTVQAIVDDLSRTTDTPRTPVLVAPMRERRAVPNAFVAGLGPLRRIVAFDVLFDLDTAHVKAVLAHEMGHVHGRHLVRRLLVLVAANAAVVAGLAMFGALETGAWSAAEYPLFAALSMVATIYAAPVLAAIGRRQERDADAFALDATRDASSFSEMIRTISVGNLVSLAPNGFATMGCAHPPPAIRMEAAARWAANRPVAADP